MDRTRFLSLLPFVVLVAAVQVAGSLITMPQISAWYAGLEKPYWNPPSWVFGPVWTVLYVLIALAGWRVWRVIAAREPQLRLRLRHPAMAWWLVQLALNAAWSPLFFGAHAISAALIVIGLMVVAIGMFMHHATRMDKTAAWMFAPYLAWTTYALTLNAGIVALNP